MMPTSLRENHNMPPAALRIQGVEAILRAARVALVRQLVLARQSGNADESWSPEDCQKFTQAVGDYRSRLNRLSGALGSQEKTRSATRHTLGSFAGRLTAIVRVASAASRAISFDEALEQASATQVDELCHEPLFAKIVTRGGKDRQVFVPGHRRRVRHLLVRDALVAAGVDSPYEYSRKGRGAFAARDAIQTAIDAGYLWWLIVDIKDFYPSVKPGHLGWLPIERSVLLNSVFIPNDVPIYDSLYQPIPFNQAARQGLPQGSTASSQIASGFHGRILQGLPGDLARMAYGDDAAIGARSQSGPTTVEQTLRMRLASLPAGPLTLKHCYIAHANDGVDFMQFRIKRDWSDGNVRSFPSRSARNKFQAEILRRHEAGATEDELHAYGVHWAKSQKWLHSLLSEDHADAAADCVYALVEDVIN